MFMIQERKNDENIVNNYKPPANDMP